jgi:putative transposase
VITFASGLLLGVMVGPASDSDGLRLPNLLQRLLGKIPRLQVVFADGGYEGVPSSLLWRCFHWVLRVVSREEANDRLNGFTPLPKLRIVERTFGWFGGYRHLSRDYERQPEVSEAMVRLAMARLMIRRIA